MFLLSVGRTMNKMTNIQDLEREVKRLNIEINEFSRKLYHLRCKALRQDKWVWTDDQRYGPDPADKELHAEYHSAGDAFVDAVTNWQSAVKELYAERFSAVMREIVAHGGRRSAWTRRGAAVNAWYARRQARKMKR